MLPYLEIFSYINWWMLLHVYNIINFSDDCQGDQIIILTLRIDLQILYIGSLKNEHFLRLICKLNFPSLFRHKINMISFALLLELQEKQSSIILSVIYYGVFYQYEVDFYKIKLLNTNYKIMNSRLIAFLIFLNAICKLNKTKILVDVHCHLIKILIQKFVFN